MLCEHDTAVTAEKKQRSYNKTRLPMFERWRLVISGKACPQKKYSAREGEPGTGHQKRRQRFDRVFDREICRSPKNVNGEKGRDQYQQFALALGIPNSL